MTIVFLWAQTALFVFIALIGVGWLTRRAFGETLALGLGIVKPTGEQILIGIGGALLMVPVVTLIGALLRRWDLALTPTSMR